MNKSKIFAKVAEIAKERDQKVELSKAHIELGAIDDLDKKYKSTASKAPKIKAQIIKLANELSSVADELDNLQDDYKKLEGMAKQLGADSVESRAKQMFQTVGNLSSAWGKAAIGVESSAKNI